MLQINQLFADNFRAARMRRKLSLEELANRLLERDIRLDESALSRIENNKRKKIYLVHAVAIALELEVSLEWLCGVERLRPTLSPDELQLIRRLRRLSPKGQKVLFDMAEALVDIEQSKD